MILIDFWGGCLLQPRPLADLVDRALEEDEAALCGVVITEFRRGISSTDRPKVLRSGSSNNRSSSKQVLTDECGGSISSAGSLDIVDFGALPMSTKRPPFDPRMSLEEFQAHYWHKEELARICRQHEIAATGIKAELQARLRAFLNTGRRETDPQRGRVARQRLQSEAARPLSLDTRLIPEGFKFDARARAFFAAYFGRETFQFTKQMAEALRAAEARADLEMTVADLLAIYDEAESLKARGLRPPPSKEEKTYQWNRFVRSFHRDPRTKEIREPLRAAAFLWRKVRDRAGDKAYRSALLDEFRRELDKFRRRPA